MAAPTRRMLHNKPGRHRLAPAQPSQRTVQRHPARHPARANGRLSRNDQPIDGAYPGATRRIDDQSLNVQRTSEEEARSIQSGLVRHRGVASLAHPQPARINFRRSPASSSLALRKLCVAERRRTVPGLFAHFDTARICLLARTELRPRCLRSHHGEQNKQCDKHALGHETALP